jgi:hypothetical protein
MFSGLMSRWTMPCVGVRERLGHFVGDSQRIVERERPVSHQPVA